MKPMKGKGSKKAPTAPKAPGTAKKGKYQSKTGNVECSNAMSVWQKALHAGITPGKQVYDKLAQCRASVRTNKQNAGKVAAGSMKQSAASAVSNRSDRRIATNTATMKARKERLKELVQSRANRNISTADRQKAMDTAAKVTGNQTGPSAGLKRLQKVAKPRAAKSAPAATTTTTTSTPKAAPNPRSRSLTPKQPVVPLNPPGFNRFAQHRADAAALLRNMRATGRSDEAASLRGYSRASLMTRIGIKPVDVRNYTGGTIMDIASKSKIGIQPVTPPQSKAAALVAKVRQSPTYGQARSSAGVNKVMTTAAYKASTGPQISSKMLAARQGAAKAADLVAKARQSGNHAGNRWDARVNRHMVSAGISARTGPQIPANVLQARQGGAKAADLVAKVRQSPRHMQNKVTGFVAKGAVTWKRMQQGPQIPKPIMTARKAAATRAANRAAKAPKAAPAAVVNTGPKLPTAPVLIVPGSRGTPSHIGQTAYQGDLMEMTWQKGNRHQLMGAGHSDAVATAASDRLQARAKGEGMTVQNRLDRLRDLRAQRKQGLAANADPDNINPTLSSGVSLVQWHSTNTKGLKTLDPTKTKTHHYSRGVYTDQSLAGSIPYGNQHFITQPPKGSVLQYQQAPRTVQSRRAIEAISEATSTSKRDVQKTLQRLNGPGNGSGGAPTYGTQNIIRLAGAAQADARGTAKMIQANNASGIPGAGGSMYDVAADKVLKGFAGVTVDTVTPGQASSRRSNYNSWFHPVTPTPVTKASMAAGKHDHLFQPGAMNRKIKLLRGPTSARDMLRDTLLS